MASTMQEKYPDLLLEAKTKDDKLQGHLSVNHKNNSHTYWLFFYDKNGIHEQESHGKIKKTQSNRVRKFTGIMPTENEIKKIF